MKIFYKLSVIFILYALLAIPDNRTSIHIPKDSELTASGRWWGKFAQNLVKYRITSKQNQAFEYNKHRQLLKKQLDDLLLELTEPDNPKLDSICHHINKLSALASLVPGTIHEFEEDVATWRKLLKYQSRYWDTSSDYANERLFQFIVEGRMAFESALIQSETEEASWHLAKNQPTTHSSTFHNFSFKNGDIIAFNSNAKDDSHISVFKELPNVSKHLGSIYINNGQASVIYLDYKKGLIIVPMKEFINDIAPNGIILRLRNDIPEMLRNPALPLLAATTIYEMATEGTYSYDYNFDIESHSSLFDWELISKAFKQQGLSLEANLFNRNTFAINIGSKNPHLIPFEVELDHRFIIAGEWYHSNLLYENRLLTAATTAIIEHKSREDFISYFKLPIYRVAKGYSVFAGLFGFNEPIPSGITAQSQLVYDAVSKKQKKLLAQLKTALNSYEKKQQHKATYLKMLQKANEIMAEQKDNS